MNKQINTTLIATTILVALSLGVFAQSFAEVQDDSTRTEAKTLYVMGSATASVMPDLFVASFGVEVQNVTAIQALKSNSEMMNAVIESIESLDLADGQISTSEFSIYPVYGKYNEDTGESPLIGYRVTNTVSVQTSDLNATASVIDGAVNAGANRVGGLYFTISDEAKSQIQDSLIADAILDAKTRAQNALAPLDHRIVGIQSIKLSDSTAYPPMPFYDGAFAEAAFAKSTPIFSSDQDVTAVAHIVFLIDSN